MTACTLNGSTSTFTYGADGLRRSMTTGGVTTYYVYDGQTMIRELQGTPGSLHATATYLTGPRGPEYRRDDTHTEPDGQGHTFGKTRWYVYDGLGSVVGGVDPLGNVTASDKYDVYGAVRGRSGTASTAHGFVGSLGHLSDAATGLVYMRARYYDPGTGRFSSEDPGKDGTNWFIYCDENPVNEVDKTGKIPTGLINGLILELIYGDVLAVNNTSLMPATVIPYVNAIDAVIGMIGANTIRIELLATVGEKGDKAGAYAAGYNAAGYGSIAVIGACGLYQLKLVEAMISSDRSDDGGGWPMKDN